MIVTDNKPILFFFFLQFGKINLWTEQEALTCNLWCTAEKAEVAG